jgi:hypothetical protein
MATTPMTKDARRVAAMAEAGGVRECLQWFTREKQWINERHIELCRIPAPTFLEQARGEWMAAQFRALGWKVETDRAGNVVATLFTPSEGPSTALTAHLDTVLAPRKPQEIQVFGDGRVLGPGVSGGSGGSGWIGTVPSIPIFLRASYAVAHHGQVGSLAGRRSKVTERRARKAATASPTGSMRGAPEIRN